MTGDCVSLCAVDQDGFESVNVSFHLSVCCCRVKAQEETSSQREEKIDEETEDQPVSVLEETITSVTQQTDVDTPRCWCDNDVAMHQL